MRMATNRDNSVRKATVYGLENGFQFQAGKSITVKKNSGTIQSSILRGWVGFRWG